MASNTEKDNRINKLVQRSDQWIEHIAGDDAPPSHRMFAAESYHKAFWEEADHAIILLDEKLNIIEANDSFCELMDITPAEASKKSFRELVPGYRLHTDYQNITALIEGRNSSFQVDEVIEAKRPIKVRIVAKRVPTALHRPFRLIIMHIYESEIFQEFNVSPKEVQPKSLKQAFFNGVQQNFGGVLFTIVLIIFMIAL